MKTFSQDNRVDAKSKIHHLPALYINHTKDNLSFGLGIFSPSGLSTEWPKDWVGRYVATYTAIKTTFINPVVAYRVNDYFSFGFGISYIKSSVEMKKAIPLTPLPDGIAKLTGDGDGIGYNVGITMKFPEQYTVSLTLRSPVTIKYSGKAYFYMPPPLATSSTGASTKITLPFIAVFGISKNIGALTLEGDILYTGWSSLGSFRISSDNGMANAFYYKAWSNTPSIAIGANYRWNKSLAVRGGYMYDKSPVPKKTLGPELPDNTRNIFTFGTTYHKNKCSIHIGYQATFFQKATSCRSTTG
jgi:long-chain fatty acid transport protein